MSSMVLEAASASFGCRLRLVEVLQTVKSVSSVSVARG